MRKRRGTVMLGGLIILAATAVGVTWTARPRNAQARPGNNSRWLAIALAALIIPVTLVAGPVRPASATVPQTPMVSAGGYHTCSLDGAGKAMCWGWNSYGQLGDGTTAFRDVPTAVSGGLTFTSITTGDYHTCALTSGGVAYCWGGNWAGQLGDTTNVDKYVPTAVPGGLTFTSISAGGSSNCGLIAGAAKCWGWNSYGQLGDTTIVDKTAPTTVAGGFTFTSIVTGGQQTCGLVAGAAKCWGYNLDGELGDGTNADKHTPTVVSGGFTFTSIVIGAYHACGLVAGAAKCWGANWNGQLGDGTTTPRNVPTTVSGSLTFTAISAGYYHTCGLVAGAAKCWGYNGNGQLGDGTTTDQYAPTAVSGSLTFVSISGGGWYTCGVTTLGLAKCWGDNSYGQVGDGTTAGRTTPGTNVSGGLTWASVSSGLNYSCGVTTGGAGYCWGYNGRGQLGDGTTGNRSSPTVVSGANVWLSISAGPGYHTCGLTTSHVAKCWGLNANGQLGNTSNTDSSTPVTVSGGFTYSSVSAGGGHSCGVRNAGTVGQIKCWGLNNHGQLGNGGTTNSNAPVTAGVTYSTVSAGFDHTCGLTTGNVIKCWGGNWGGQLGANGTTEQHAPAAVAGTWLSVSAGDYHTCGISNTNVAKCWGWNGNGQLGDGTNTNQTVPTTVLGSITFTSLAGGMQGTCGLTGAGVTYCWGQNNNGRLGDGTQTDRSSPTLAQNGITWSAISTGLVSSCGLTGTTIKCWGSDSFGQLGDAIALYSTALVTAIPLDHVPAPMSWWNASYAKRYGVTVTSADALVSGYSVSVTFNHAALVTGAASLASGNDVRVVYWNGATWTELDRLIDPSSSWNSSTTKIWFRTQAAIPASFADTSYYLYYGYPSAGAPPANGNNIFDLYDDFSGGSLDGAKWTAGTSTGITVIQTGGELKISGTNDAAGQWDFDGIRSLGTIFSRGYAAESSIKIVSQSVAAQSNWKSRLGPTETGVSIRGGNVAIWNGAGYTNLAATSLTGQTFPYHRVATAFSSTGVMREWEDGTLKGSSTAFGTPDNGVYFNYGPDVAGGVQTFDVRFDNVWVRKFVANEPTLALDSTATSPMIQTKTDDSVVATGAWINSASVKFSSLVNDADSGDIVSLCVEAQPLGTGFTGSDTCGTAVASGTSATVTIGSLVSGTQYHWQARAKDNFGASWPLASYGNNAEAAADFGIDITGPVGGTVYDGTNNGVEVGFSTTSLSTLSGNWTGFSDAISGVASYEYAIGTTAGVGGTDVKVWTSNASSTSVTATGLTLRTTQLYYVNVRATDGLGNVSSVVSSNGQMVTPSLTFSVDKSSLAFSNLNSADTYTDSKALVVTTSGNAYGGYVVRQYKSGLPTNAGARTIADYAGTYATSTTWAGGTYGFGFTSNDTSIQASGDLFGSASKYAAVTGTGPGDIVADHVSAVSGTPFGPESFTLTYKVAVPANQAPGTYSTTLTLAATAIY
jgi:alpha-tubulin suppressor-like RCC1 family protein